MTNICEFHIVFNLLKIGNTIANIMAESKIVQLNLENSIASYNVFNIIFMHLVC